MALLNQKAFERKLQNMSSTQDSVQTVSLWMIHHKKHAEDMVSVWLEQLKKGKIAVKINDQAVVISRFREVKAICLKFSRSVQRRWVVMC